MFSVRLAPRQGDRFQPTGFPNIGPGIYRRPGGMQMLLVESSQSMANRLEETIVADGYSIIKELDGLPYVTSTIKIKHEDDIDPEQKGKSEDVVTTSSLVEPHRLNSDFILNAKRDSNNEETFADELIKEFQFERYRPVNWRIVVKTLFKYDPNTLLHGAFFSQLKDGRIKIPRAVSAFIEAENVEPAESGGVKKNIFDLSSNLEFVGNIKRKGGTQMIPFNRTEFTAEKITAYFNMDLSLLREYDAAVTKEKNDCSGKVANFLYLLSVYKIRRFLSRGLRLRSSCDLEVVDEEKKAALGSQSKTYPPALQLDVKTIEAELQRLIRELRIFFAEPPVTKLETCMRPKRNKKEKNEEAGEANAGTDSARTDEPEGSDSDGPSDEDSEE
jgi:CRISPR-associated protein Csb1